MGLLKRKRNICELEFAALKTVLDKTRLELEVKQNFVIYSEEEYNSNLGDNRKICQYMIIVKEVAENKTLHLQDYIEFAKRITFIKFIKILGRNFHAKSRKGNQR